MTGNTSDLAQGAERGPQTGAVARLTGATLAVTDWSEAPCAGMGRVMAHRDLDLATALCVFFQGAPERFNYLPKRQVPDGYRPVARQLDNICQRINSGFYLPVPGVGLACTEPLDRWLGCQRADRQEGRCGRWVLDEELLAPLFDTASHQAPAYQAPAAARPAHGGQSLWRAVLAPLLALGGSRPL